MTLELAHDHLKRVLPERSILSCASMSCSDGYILLLSYVDVMKKQCAWTERCELETNNSSDERKIGCIHTERYIHTHTELRVLGGKCMCSNCICHLPPRNTLSLPSDKSSSAHAGVYCYFVCVCAIIWPSLIAMHPIPHSASYYRFPCLGATLYSLPLNPQNTIFGVDAGVIFI